MPSFASLLLLCVVCTAFSFHVNPFTNNCAFKSSRLSSSFSSTNKMNLQMKEEKKMEEEDSLFFVPEADKAQIIDYENKAKLKWPTTRPPIPSIGRQLVKMDASWGRGKYRTEVWEDDANPINLWWEAYTVSEEELEASECGYDLKNPNKWFDDREIDFTKAKEDYERDAKLSIEEYRNAENAPFDPVAFENLSKKYASMVVQLKEYKAKGGGEDYQKFLEGEQGFVKVEALYLAQHRRFREYTHRLNDNVLQAKKGQPSLDSEDTGEQYKNDPN